jgi:ribosomal protein S18 acetylase RimI-like enzyme
VDRPGMLAALTPGDAGEVLTLQRAAFVTEAQAHRDLDIPPLTQTLADLRAELGERCCHGWGIREAGRLVACVRAHLSGDTAELTRLAVAPDRQGHGIGTRLLLATEDLLPPQVRTIGLATGQHSHANLRLYRRHGYRQTHTTQAGAYLLVHLAKTRPHRTDAATATATAAAAGPVPGQRSGMPRSRLGRSSPPSTSSTFPVM